MARITVTGSVNVDSLSWLNFDNLLINNGAVVTISTPQVKCWKNVNINNGELRIVNTSSTVPIRFLMGRNAGATANIISGSTGLGAVTITGSWIYLGTGDGQPNQTLTQPYTDFVPAIWVETTSGSNDFIPWFNITTQIGESLQYFYKDLQFAFSGSMGNFFVQETIKEPYPISFTGSISSSLSSSIRSGFGLLHSASLYFGDGVSGNVIPSGSRVRIPNILVTDVTPLNLQTATSATSANFVGTTGCVFRFNTVLFDESYGNFSQPQILEMKNCAWSEYPLISECYSVTIENVALAAHPIRRYYPTTNAGWSTRDLRWGTQCAWSYMSNAVINGLYICNFSPTALIAAIPTAASVTNASLYISYTKNLQVNNLKIYNLYKSKNFQYGIILYYVNDSNFENIELYGGDYINIFNSVNNTFNATTGSAMFGNHTPSFTSTWRIGSDPNTGQSFELGKKYYLKTRSYRSWQDTTGSFPSENIYYYQTGSEFIDSMEYSFTPYTSSRESASYRNHPDYFGAYPTQSNISSLTVATSSLIWIQRSPAIGYQVYRYTESMSPIRDGRTLVYSSSTVATVTYTDTGSTSKPLNMNTPTYYVLRKYDGNLDGWSESAEQECVMRSPTYSSNHLLQSSDFSFGGWVKTGVSVTANARIGPNDAPIGTAASTTADLLLFTSATGNTSITASTISGSIYNFSVYLSSLTSSVSMSISASSGTINPSSSYVLNQTWNRAYLSFTASSATTTVGIFGNNILPVNTKIYAFGAQLCSSGSRTPPYVGTTTAPVIQRPASLEFSSIRPWSRGDAGCGVELQFNSPTANTLWWELFVSTSSNFIPSKKTLAATSWAVGAGNPIYLSNATNNVFNGFKQVTSAGYGNGFITLLNASSNNKFYNFDIDFAYGAGAAFTINTLANDNFFHNWYIKNYRNYVNANYWILAVNNAQGVTIQNLYSNNADIPLANNNLDVELKNVSAANGRPATNASTYTLISSAVDRNSVSYAQVYDTIFNEFIWNPPSGSMTLNFNASSKNPPPYNITGTILFSNTGQLYFNSTGSIEYVWPWKIYGISGFRPSHLCDAGTGSLGNAYLDSYLVNTIDLGDLDYIGYSLKKEISFKTGSEWSPYYLLTGSNADYTSQTFDPSVGFNMKVKLTSRAALKFDGQGTTPTSSFIVGEYITGSISNANALIVDQEDRSTGTTGILILEEITGSFRDNEVLKVGSLNKGFANGTGSVAFIPDNILLPQPTSYIASMQWFTIVNTSSLYPIASPTLTVSGMKSGSKIDVIRQSDSFILDASYVTSDSIDYEFIYDYFQDTPVYLIIQGLGYVYQRINAILTESDLTIPIQQIIDRNYSNPFGP